jgi:hypothetical protein
MRKEVVNSARDNLSRTTLNGRAARLDQQIEAFDDEAGKRLPTVPVGHVTGTDTLS